MSIDLKSCHACERSGRLRPKTPALADGEHPESHFKKAARSVFVSERTEMRRTHEPPRFRGGSYHQVGGTGFEYQCPAPRKRVLELRRGAHSGAPSSTCTDMPVSEVASQTIATENGDPLLAQILRAWNSLSDHDRTRLVGVAESLATR